MQLSRAEIEEIIPHRAPFIFVDEISDSVGAEAAAGAGGEDGVVGLGAAVV